MANETRPPAPLAGIRANLERGGVFAIGRNLERAGLFEIARRLAALRNWLPRETMTSLAALGSVLTGSGEAVPAPGSEPATPSDPVQRLVAEQCRREAAGLPPLTREQAWALGRGAGLTWKAVRTAQVEAWRLLGLTGGRPKPGPTRKRDG